MKPRYRNIAFLAELLVNILVFSLSCAILVGVFGKASAVARNTREEAAATAEVYALLETMRVRGLEEIDLLENQPDGGMLRGYDTVWQPVGMRQAVYTVSLHISSEQTEAGRLQHIVAVARNNAGRRLCTFETSLYLPEEGGGMP